MNNPESNAPRTFAVGETNMSIADIFNVLLENAKLIGYIVSGILLGAILYLMIAKPIYEITGMVQIDQTMKGLGNSLAPIEAMLTGELPSEGEIEIIRSRSVLGKTVDELHLDIEANPSRFPIIGPIIAKQNQGAKEPVEPVLWMSSYGWGGESIKIEVLDLPMVLWDEDLELVAEENNGFKLLGPDGNVIFEGKVGEKAGRGKFGILVSELVARPGTYFDVVRHSRYDTILDYQEDFEIEELGRQTGVIQLVLYGKNPNLTIDTVNSVINHYVQQNVERKSAEAEKTLAFMESYQPKVKSQLEEAEDKLNAYKEQKGSIELTLETQSMLSQIVDLESQMSQLKLQREELLQRFSPRHPSLLSVDSKMRELQRQIDSENDRLKGLPETQKELLALTREVEVRTELYTYMMNRAQELNLLKAGTVGDVRVIDYAEMPFEPAFPIPSLIIVLAIFLGLLVGSIVALLRSAMHQGVDNAEVIEERIGKVVYAILMHSREQGKAASEMKEGKVNTSLLALRSPTDPAIEGLRGFSANLHFSLEQAQKRAICISGVSPGAGKSFTSTNLALVLAQSGMRVLLVDADIRKGHLHTSFGVEQEPGFTSVLAGVNGVDEVLCQTPVDNLHLIPSGKYPPNPVELLMGERFKEFVKRTLEEYDYVIFDSAPILSVVDPAIISREMGATFLVVKAGENTLHDVGAAINRFKQSEVEIQGVLLNGLKPKALGQYGYGNYTYYGYGEYGKS